MQILCAIIPACAVVSLTFCAETPSISREPPYFTHADFRPADLNGEILSNAVALGQPRALALTHAGEVLWVADGATDPGLHAFSTSTGELVVSVGRRGEGPGEFSSSPFGLIVDPEDSAAVWAWDLRLQRLSRFEPRPPTEYVVSTVLLHSNPRLYRIAWVSAGRLVGQSASLDKRFSIFSPDGEFLGAVEGHLLGDEQIPEQLRNTATNSGLRLCDWPDHGFVIAYISLGRIEYYDASGNLSRVAKVPYPSDVAYEATPDGGRLADGRRWYSACSASGDYLFALFSGRLRAAYEGDASFGANFVHVFDRDGRLRVVYRLDRDVNDIVVDERNGILYAASAVDAAVYRFHLPTLDDGVAVADSSSNGVVTEGSDRSEEAEWARVNGNSIRTGLPARSSDPSDPSDASVSRC